MALRWSQIRDCDNCQNEKIVTTQVYIGFPYLGVAWVRATEVEVDPPATADSRSREVVTLVPNYQALEEDRSCGPVRVEVAEVVVGSDLQHLPQQLLDPSFSSSFVYVPVMHPLICHP